MKPITHHFTERQIERLKAEAQRTGLTVAEILRRAVDAWLDRAEKEGEKEVMTAVCIVCGKEFEKKTNHVSTCGVECRKESRRQYNRKFQARPDRIELERQRNLRRVAERGPVMAACMVCGKEFRKIKGAMICGPECREVKRHPPRKPTPVIEPFPSDIDRDTFGQWLSGFADGEATFRLGESQARSTGKILVSAMFRIALRDDEIETLHLIRSFWRCGTLYFGDNKRSKIANARPIAAFGVQKVSDLIAAVIPHFERYRMFAKKRRDFEVWRRGVELMARVQERQPRKRPGMGGWHPRWTAAEREQFHSLSDELKNVRRYIPHQQNNKQSTQRMLFADKD